MRLELERLEAKNLFAGLVGEFPYHGGPIEIRSTDAPVDVVGLSLTSSNDGLVPVPSSFAFPFLRLLANSADEVTYASPGRSVRVDGSLTLGVHARPFAVIEGEYGVADQVDPMLLM